MDKLIRPVDNPVDNMWITLWTVLWIIAFMIHLWISYCFIHSLSTTYAQFSHCIIHRRNSIAMRD